MPCSDITEEIEVVLDAEDRLCHYRFVKRTCGQGIGVASLLDDLFGGWGVEAILSLPPESCIERLGGGDEVEAFLALKHLFALQAVLAVWSGQMEGGQDAPCSVLGIEFDGDRTRIEAEIPIETLTERIEACGACGTCGERRLPAPPRHRKKPQRNTENG